MTFDVGIKFSVETQELINARNALQSLAQAAKDLNNNQDKAANAADKLTSANEKAAKAASESSSASSKAASGTKELGEASDAASAKLEKLREQLKFLRNDDGLTSTGVTRSQAGVLAWAKSVGAAESTIKEFISVYDDFNKVVGENALDKSVSGFLMLTRQVNEFTLTQKLAKENMGLTSEQVKMLARDLEALKQQNEAAGKSFDSGAKETIDNFVRMARSLNELKEEAKQAEIVEKQRAAAAVKAIKEEEQARKDLIDSIKAVATQKEAAARAAEQAAAKELAALELNRKKVNDTMMQSWSGGIGGKSPELEQMANFYKEEERAANENKARLDSIRESANSQMMRDWATQLSNKSSTLSKMANFYKEEERLALENANRLEAARKQVNNAMMQQWAGSVGQKSPELTNLASQYAEEEKQAMLRKAEATKAAAAADKIAADAIAYLERESSKLVATNDLLSRGFTQASANALYKYKEALQAAGVSTNELKQRLYTLEQDLMTKQQMSPFTKMREDMGKMQQDVKHLARAISVQLGDVFISLAGGQNPLLVMIQQGDQIRGALQQAKDAEQDLSKAMQGAFSNMASSFKLVGTVLKEFVTDGFNTVAGSMQTVIGRGKELDDINKRLAEGSITPLRAQRLEYVALANAMQTLRLAALGMAAAVGGVLLKAYYDLSQENFELSKNLALTGASLGLSSAGAIELASSMKRLGVSTTEGKQILTAMAKEGGFTAEQFTVMSDAAVAYSNATGMALSDVIKKFSEVNKDPVKALSDLQIAQGNVSEEVLENVRTLAEQGEKLKAAEVAAKEYARAQKEVATEIIDAMPWYKEMWIWIDKSAQAVWDLTKGLFGLNGASAGLKQISSQLDEYEKSGKTPWWVVGPIMEKDWYAGALQKREEFRKQVESSDAQAAERQRKSQVESNRKLVDDFLKPFKEVEEKLQSKSMSKQAYINKQLEDYRTRLQGAAESAKDLATIEKAAAKQWEDMQKKSSGSTGPKPKETYKVDRSNELAETKKFYDEQLKQLKDAESKQEAILKQSYDAKMISFGEYYAKQTELSLTSQKEQLAVINESSDKQKAAIQSRMLDHVAAFEKEVKAGGNVVALTDKLEAELANLTRTYGGVTQATDTQTQALQTATDKKFYEFYKELNKNLNESTSAFEKFSETVANNAANRQADLDLQRKLLGTYGAEAEALKASTSATRSYSAEIKKQTDLLKKQDEVIAGLRKGRDGLTDKAAKDKVDQEIVKRLEERAEIEKTLGETTALAKQDAEQAAIDAVAAYNIKVFQEVRDAISSDLYDAIFEGGSKGADALKNVLKNSFKNFVINAYINPVVGNVVGSVMGAIGMGGGLSGAGTGGMGGFSLGGGSFDIGQSLIDYGYDLAGTSTFMGDAVSSLGTSIKGLETTIKGIPGLEGGYGSVLGYGSALLSLSEGKYGSALGTGIGTYLMPTLGPLAPMVGSMLGGLLDDTLGDLFSGGPPNLGSAYTYNTKTGASKQYGGPEDLGVDADKVTAQLMESTVTGINDLFKKLGSAAKVEDFWGGFAAREDGGDSAWAGGMLSNGVKFGQQWSKDIETELGSVEEAMKRYQEELSKATLDALKQATDIPEYIQTKLKDVDVQALSGEGVTKLVGEISNLIAAVEGVNNSFDLMGISLDTASAKSGEYQLSLVESTGGMEAFTSNMSSYYENFYSESERSAKAMESLTETFANAGIEIPATREEYRKLVEAAAAGGDATKDQLATLLKLSGAFASLVPATTGANKQIDSLNKTMQALGVNAKLTATKFDKSTTEMFESIGLSVEDYSKSIASVLQGIMLGTIPAEEAGVQLANAAVGGITSAIAAGAAQTIAAEFTNSIIAPIVANMMAGKAALDGIDMATTAANITAQASAVATALAALGPTLSEALNGIISSISSVAIPGAGGGSSGSSSGGGGSPFSAGPGTPRYAEIPTVKEWVEATYGFSKSVTEANARVTELLSEMLKDNEVAKSHWEELADKRNELFSKDLQGYKDARDYAKKRAEELKGSILSEEEFAKEYGGMYSSEDLDAAYAYYMKQMQEAIYIQERGYNWNIKAITELEGKIREWTVAQTRLLATEEYVALAKETQAAIDKTEELKLTGGLEDPITKLKQQFAEKMKNFNDNIKKALMDEVEALKAQKPDDEVMSALQQSVDYNKMNLDDVSGENLTQRISWTEKLIQDQKDAIEELTKNADMSTVEGVNAYLTMLTGMQGELMRTQQYLEKLKSGEATAEAQKAYEEAQQAMLDALLKATNPAKQQELLDEIAKYEDGITGWFKAQAELLSTEMLIDINNQIKQLETEEKGPLTTIKDAIQKYIDDFTELGTLNEEIQAALDKLSELQLTKAREELYNQLLSEGELKSIQQAKLSESFKDLGTELPASADALRAMIDAARAAGNITLADKLLELVPAFMALQDAAGGVSKGLDEANKAFDVFKRAVEAQIKELEKTFTATDLAMRVLEKAVEAEKKRLNEQLKTAQESVKTLQKIFDTLDKGVKELRNEVEQTKQMQADEARRVIDVANLTGVLPDADRLSEAVSALTSSVQDGLYATAYDKSRAFLTLANDLEKLKDTTEPQLTSAEQTVVNLEKQIEQLDDLLEAARKQIDELRGIDASLFGIDEGITQVDLALKQLQNAAQAEEQARKQIDVLNQQLEMYQKQLDALNGIDTSVKSVEDAIRDLEAAIASMGSGNNSGSTPTTGGVYPAPWEPGTGGVYPTPWEPTTSQSTNHVEYIQIPGFAVGTNYVPKDMLANIHEGEMIIPKRFNPSTSGLQQDNSELVDELKALRAEVSMLRAEARATAVNTSKTARILDDVTQGGDTLKTEVAV